MFNYVTSSTFSLKVVLLTNASGYVNIVLINRLKL